MTAEYEAQLAEAQKAIDDAEALVELAKAEYDRAVTESTQAADYATKAAEELAKATEAAQTTIDNLEALKGVGELETLQQNVETAKGTLAEATANKEAVNKAQDEIITEKENYKAEQQKIADDKQKEIDNLSSEITSLGDQITAQNNEVNKQQGIIDNNAALANKKTTDVKKTVEHYYVDGKEVNKATYIAAYLAIWTKKTTWTEKIYYTQSEIDDAKKAVSDATEAKTAANNEATRLGGLKTEKETAKGQAISERDIANGNVSAAQEAIDAANRAKTDALNAETNANNSLAQAEATLAVLTKYMYTDETTPVVYFNRDNDQTFKKELAEALEDNRQYSVIVKDTADYKEATDGYDSFLDWLLNFIPDVFTEHSLEAKYRDWNWSWDGGEETHVLFVSDGSNYNTLVTLCGEKLTITKVSEAEFATYSATFDQVAAAQAAKKAADAAANEATQLANYNAAREKLTNAQKALNDIQLNPYIGAVDYQNKIIAATEALNKAKQEADSALTDLNKAKEEAALAKQAAEDAQKIADSKPNRPSNEGGNYNPSNGGEGGEGGYAGPAVRPTVAPAVIEEVVVEDAVLGANRKAPKKAAAVAEEPAETVEAVEAVPEKADEVTIVSTKELQPETPVEKVVTIPDSDVALAATPEEAETMSWWWALIVAVLGGAGFEIYRRNKAKKASKVKNN